MQTDTSTLRWDRHFLRLAVAHAEMSRDPSTRVGAVLVGEDRTILSAGFNGLPRGIADTPERLNDRAVKLRLVVHGEMNAILAAAANGVRLRGSTLYLAATDSGGAVWGGAPCVRCTVEAMQAGIRGIVCPPARTAPSRWHDDIREATELLREAGIPLREVEFP